jgi:hypothetical protein
MLLHCLYFVQKVQELYINAFFYDEEDNLSQLNAFLIFCLAKLLHWLVLSNLPLRLWTLAWIEDWSVCVLK